MFIETAITKTEKRLVPVLRFEEFRGEWQKWELEKLTDKISVGIATEVRPYVSTMEDVPLLRNQNIKVGYFDDSSMEFIISEFDESNKTKRVQSKDVIIVRTGSNMGNACVVPEQYNGSQTFTTLIVRPTKSSLNSEFLSFHINYLGLSEIQRLSAGGGKPNLNSGFLKKYRINVGELAEQQKIATFLTAVDEKINLLKTQKSELERYKKGVMQKIFPSASSGASPELRFKDEEGKEFPKWEKRKLSSVLFEHKLKSNGTEEVFSVSVHKGLINQIEHLGRSFSAANTDHYNLVKHGDLVYTKSPTGDFPLGIIKQSDIEEDVIVSPLYGIFTPETKGLGYLLHTYFESHINVSNYLSSIIQKGAKNTINITNTTFLSKSLFLPTSKIEQEKIGGFLQAIQLKIDVCSEQITKMEVWKKGLLQRMFV